MLKGREVLKGGGYGGDIEGKGGVGMEGDGQTLSWGMGARSSSVIVPVMCPCRCVLSLLFIVGGAGALAAIHQWWVGPHLPYASSGVGPRSPLVVWGPRRHSSVVVWGSVLWFKGGGGGHSFP